LPRPPRKKKTGIILARDSEGDDYYINEHSVIFDTSPFGHAGVTTSGLLSYALIDGSDVDKTGETEFRIRTSGIVLHFVTRQPIE